MIWGTYTAGTDIFLFFCSMVTRPVCVIGARCPVAVVVSVLVLFALTLEVWWYAWDLHQSLV